MNLYKITVKPISSFCSHLQSDTFFGAFCWSYLYKYGESALHNLICNYKGGRPDIIFSNAFPSGRLPMPIGIHTSMREKEVLPTKQERYRRYIANKSRQQSSTVPLSEFNRIIHGDIEVLLDKEDSAPEQKIEPSMEWRNMVSRETNTVENVDGAGNLFELEQFFTEGTFDLFMYSSFDKTILESVLLEMFRNGIGAKRSVGKGAFEIVGKVELFDGFQLPSNANAFVALSNFIPQKQDPTDGYYKAFVKYPSLSYTDHPEDSPFKKPLIFFKSGSVFRDQPVKKFYGSCIENIALKKGHVSRDIIIGAYTIAVPCLLTC